MNVKAWIIVTIDGRIFVGKKAIYTKEQWDSLISKFVEMICEAEWYKLELCDGETLLLVGQNIQRAIYEFRHEEVK